MTKTMVTRKCIGCGESKPKQELLRVIKTPEGKFEIDRTGKRNGRGAYICKNANCMKQALKTKALDRSYKMSVPKETYEALIKEMQEDEA